MKWTTMKPKVPGWYWWRTDEGDRGIDYFDPNNEMIPHDYICECAGPLPLPSEG